MKYSFPRHLNPFKRTSSRRALAAGSASVLAAGLAVLFVGPAQASPSHTGAHPSTERDVSANLFEWNWPSVANECTHRARPGRLRRRTGRPAAGLGQADVLGNGTDSAAPLVGGLPAGRLQPDQSDGHEPRSSSRWSLTCRRAGVKVYRRRRHQPHDRPGRHVLRWRQLQQIRLRRLVLSPTTSTATRPTVQCRRPRVVPTGKAASPTSTTTRRSSTASWWDCPTYAPSRRTCATPWRRT